MQILIIETGDFLRGKIIPVKQIGYGIPKFDETGEGFELLGSSQKKIFRIQNCFLVTVVIFIG